MNNVITVMIVKDLQINSWLCRFMLVPSEWKWICHIFGDNNDGVVEKSRMIHAWGLMTLVCLESAMMALISRLFISYDIFSISYYNLYYKSWQHVWYYRLCKFLTWRYCNNLSILWKLKLSQFCIQLKKSYLFQLTRSTFTFVPILGFLFDFFLLFPDWILIKLATLISDKYKEIILHRTHFN